VDEVFQPLPGIEEAVKLLHAAGHLLGLVTGNLEPIAHAKLSRVGLDQYFRLGGFGSDHQQRAELVRIAVRRAREEFSFPANGVVHLIGDTPKDIAAGKAAGVLTVGVATGHFALGELERAGADLALSSFAEFSRLEERLG